METESTMENRETPGLVKVAENHDKEIARFGHFGLPALLAAAMLAFGMYRNPQGIAFTVPVAGAFVLMAYLSEKKRFRSYQAFLCAVCILLSVHVWTSASGPLHFLDRLGITVLGALFLIESVRSKRASVSSDPADDASKEPDPGAYLVGILRVSALPFARSFIPFTDAAAFAGSRIHGRSENAGRRSRAVLRGLLLAMPLLLIVILLLADADAVFNRILVRAFSDLTVPDLAMNSILILLIAVCGFILFYTLSSFFYADAETEDMPDNAAGRLVRCSAGSGEPLTAITIVFLLTAVYVCFCAIQLVCLAGRMALPEGITYAQYAHEGFYQLAIVCAINLVIMNVCRSHFRRHRLLSALLLVMSCCTFIMIASSAARMFLYIREYQLTFLRVFVLWFLTVLTIWLLAVCVSILRPGIPVFKIWVVTAAVMYLLFAFAHPDYWIARYNLAAPSVRDEWYIVNSLSDDAVPAYAAREDLRQQRLTYKLDMENASDMLNEWPDRAATGARGIRTFNLSESIARRYLERQQK